MQNDPSPTIGLSIGLVVAAILLAVILVGQKKEQKLLNDQYVKQERVFVRTD